MYRTTLLLLALTLVVLPACDDGPTDEPAVTAPAADVDTDRDGLSNAMEQQLGTDLENPDPDGDGLTDGAELARGTDPLKGDEVDAEAATDEPAGGDVVAAVAGDTPAAAPADDTRSVWIGTVTDASEDTATDKLKSLCTNDFTATFRFQAQDHDDEWKVVLEDIDDSTVTYVNLDDAGQLEVEHPAGDYPFASPASAGEQHKAAIRYVQPHLTVTVDGRNVVSGYDVGSYDQCMHVKVRVDDGMTLSRFNVAYR